MNDLTFDAYRDVLNETLFDKFNNPESGEIVMWLGDNRWVIMNSEGPDMFMIEIHRAKVEPK